MISVLPLISAVARFNGIDLNEMQNGTAEYDGIHSTVSHINAQHAP